MHDDEARARKMLREDKQKERYYEYRGVREADIRYACPADGLLKRDSTPFLGADPRGDWRLKEMLKGLTKYGLVEENTVRFKKKRDSEYYTLTPLGEENYNDLQDLIKKKPISEILYCLKNHDKVLQRRGGKDPLVKISELVETK